MTSHARRLITMGRPNDLRHLCRWGKEAEGRREWDPRGVVGGSNSRADPAGTADGELKRGRLTESGRDVAPGKWHPRS
jgi:hypothetical protein